MHSKVRERTKETAPAITRRAHGEAVRQFSAFCSETGITILPSRITHLLLTWSAHGIVSLLMCIKWCVA